MSRVKSSAALRLDLCCRFIIIVAALALPVVWLWPHSFRESRPMLIAIVWAISMARTFCIEIGCGLAVLAAVLLVCRRRRVALVSATVACAWAAPLLGAWGLRSGGTIAGPSLVMMTCNVLGQNRDYDAILRQIELADPDILAIQEYTPHLEAALGSKLRERLPHVATAWWNERFGMAVYSRTPFVNQPEVMTIGGSGRDMLRVEIRLDGRDVAVYNVHPSHPAGVRLVAQGRREFADILQRLDGERLPAIVMGDFNASTWSPQASALLARGFRDAHSIAGEGFGATWPARGPLSWLPEVRIDHVYVGPGLIAGSCRVGGRTGSDHRPVIARVGWE